MTGVLEIGVVFVTITLIAGALMVLVRSIIPQRSTYVSQQLNGSLAEVLPEELLLPTIPQRGAGPIGRFDAWFERMMAETGTKFSALSAILCMLAAGLAIGGGLFVWRENLLLAAAGLAVGILGVAAIFYYLRYQRLSRIDSQLPEVLEFIARAVRAGETLDQGISLVAETSIEPTASELRVCVRQLELGLSMDATLRALTQRVPLMELRLFAAALVLQRRSGGSLATTLERFAKAIRERHAYRRQLKVATASARWAAIVIVAATMGMLVYLFGWQPDYINQFLDSRMGQIVFATALILQVVGVLWVLNLTQAEV
jgi:tight adherence protein B